MAGGDALGLMGFGGALFVLAKLYMCFVRDFFFCRDFGPILRSLQ